MRAARSAAGRRARLQLVSAPPNARPSPVKTLRAIEIERRGAYWRFDFDADAFLHHMIRNIMGCLLAVGSGQQPPEWLAEVLAARDRDAAAPTFAPDGLYFRRARTTMPPMAICPSTYRRCDWLP